MIWVVGSRGMLGREIAAMMQQNGSDFISTDLELDITDYDAVENFAFNKKIDWIINCAAYTNVDKAEEEEELALHINADGVKNLAFIAEQKKAKIIHFSTDYVFDGNSRVPYKETDKPNPQTVYGSTKLQGEIELRATVKRYFIFRISWLYGQYGNNFVTTMLKFMNERDELKVVNDQFGAPTYTKSLSKNIVKLIKAERESFGIYHYSDAGEISWYNFAVKIYELGLSESLLNNKVTILPIATSEYKFKTKRPAYSLLDKSKVRSGLGFNVNDWENNLKDFITGLKAKRRR